MFFSNHSFVDITRSLITLQVSFCALVTCVYIASVCAIPVYHMYLSHYRYLLLSSHCQSTDSTTPRKSSNVLFFFTHRLLEHVAVIFIASLSFDVAGDLRMSA